MNELIKGRKKKPIITWTFVLIIQALVSAPILCSPDFTRPFTIRCDASDTGIAGLLVQEIDDLERVIAYVSRSLSKRERNWTVTYPT